jgi:Flp pilus assembly protein TadD
MSTRSLWVLPIAAALALPAPAWATEPWAVAAKTVGPSASDTLKIETPAEVMALPSELRARLHDEVLAGEPPQMVRFQRLIHFIVDAHGLGMVYREDDTRSVAQSYATRTANCVGFTLLFLALAREAGLDASAQSIRQTLSWHQDESTLYLSSHVNALVRIGAREYVVDFAVEPVIARNRPEPTSDQGLLAHYYNNLAVEHLDQHWMASAQRLIETALSLDPASAAYWSNAGVIHLRNGDTAGAERAYTQALKLDARDAGALFNMASLAHRTGNSAREAEFQRRLGRVQQQDPFHQFMQAMAFENSGDYSKAIDHYRLAIRLHGKEPRFHAALARAFELSGDHRHAVAALKHAASLSEGEQRDRYRQQWQDLRQASN